MLNQKIKSFCGVRTRSLSLCRGFNRRGQSILELFSVLLVVTLFFGAAFVFNNIFEISQKQTMLVRTQAMLELGNYSDFGNAQHGQDKLGDNASALVFRLGIDNPGTRLNIDEVPSFKKVVEGEMKFDGALPEKQEKFWQQFGFPRGIVKYKWDIGKDDIGTTKEYTMTQTAGIAANRSLKLTENPTDINQAQMNSFGGGTGMYSGGTHYNKWQGISKLQVIPGVGLIDNTAFIDEQLKNIIQNDPSLAREAQEFRNRVSAMDGLTGGGVAAIIAAVTALASMGMAALAPAAPAGEVAGGAAGSATATANNIIQTLGGGGGLIEGATLFNAGQILTTASNGLSLVNSGLALGGKQVEGLQIAAGVTGALGGIAGGLSSFQKFDGFKGELLGQGGLNSDIFMGVSKLSGGVGTLGGYADPKFGAVAGIVSTVSGFGGVVTGFHENFTGVNKTSGWFKTEKDAASGLYKDVAVGDWVPGAGWAATSAAGGVIAGAGGVAGIIAPKSDLGMGLSLAGGAVGLVGAGGSLAQGLGSGKISFSDKPLEAMVQVAGVTGAAAGLGGSVAGITGNAELAEKFGYAAIGAGAVTLVGAVGILANTMGEAAKNSKKDETNPDGSPKAASSDKKEAVVDNRTDFQKLNDAKGAIDKAIGVGSFAVATTGTVKGAVDTYNTQMDAADALRTATIEKYEADQKEVTKLRADATKAEGVASLTPAGNGRTQSGVSATEVENLTAQGVINQMTALNAKKNSIRAELTPDLQVRFDEYVETLQASEAHITQRRALNQAPDQQVVRDMLIAYQGANRIIEMQEAYVRQTGGDRRPVAGPTQVDPTGILMSASITQQQVRALSHQVATRIRAEGAISFANQMGEISAAREKPAQISSLRKYISELDSRVIVKKFGKKDGSRLVASLRRADEALAIIDESLSRGETPTRIFLETAQAEIEKGVEIIEKKQSVPPRGSVARKEREGNQWRADLAVVNKANQDYERALKEGSEIKFLVETAEKHFSDRPVMATSHEERRRFRRFAIQSAERIETFSDTFLKEGGSEYRRFDRAQEVYERVRFVTPREALTTLKTHYENRSKRYVELKAKVIEAQKNYRGGRDIN